MSEIKMTDLIAGETVLLTRTGGEQMVLEVFSGTICLSELNNISVACGLYTPKELNVDGYTIKPKDSLADKYPKDTPVVTVSGVRYSAGQTDDQGWLKVYRDGTTSLTYSYLSSVEAVKPYMPKD